MKKILFLFFSFLFLVKSSFSLASRELEVEYPALPTGETLTAASPFSDYMHYLYNFGMSLGFLAVFLAFIIAGFIYITSAGRPEKVQEAKSRIVSALSGMLLLVATYLILTTINPSLSVFRDPEVDHVEVGETGEYIPLGVYLYKGDGCTKGDPDDTNDPLVLRSGRPNLREFSGDISSVNIRGPYISILYSMVDYRGSCYYINPNAPCDNLGDEFSNFAASASVHEYEFNPSGTVTFYRKPFHDKDGGYLEVHGSETANNNYGKNLEDLRFENVPEEEKDCVKWDFQGKCTERESPNLAGSNISSIKIEGGSFVVLFKMVDARTGEINHCQEFPTPYDEDGGGPVKIKWEYLNYPRLYADYVSIYPVKE